MSAGPFLDLSTVRSCAAAGLLDIYPKVIGRFVDDTGVTDRAGRKWIHSELAQLQPDRFAYSYSVRGNDGRAHQMDVYGAWWKKIPIFLKFRWSLPDRKRIFICSVHPPEDDLKTSGGEVLPRWDP